MREEGGSNDDVRVCVRHTPSGEHFIQCQVLVSVGLFNLVTGKPKKVFRCEVAKRSFFYYFLHSPHETRDKEEYETWVQKAYGEVEKQLGFKPIEGLWTFDEEK